MESPNLPGEVAMRNEITTLCSQPENKLLAAIRTVEKTMKQLNCCLHKGDIYVKPACSVYTYVYHKNITDFLHQLTGNPKMAEALVGLISPIANMLTNPSCAVIPQIEIDLNLIEVPQTILMFTQCSWFQHFTHFVRISGTSQGNML